MELKKTERGFQYFEWTDRYGEVCSLQESSLATEACIWLGIDNAKVKQCFRGEGWKEVPLPHEAYVFSRMHLTQNMVRELLPILQRFVETGEIREPDTTRRDQ